MKIKEILSQYSKEISISEIRLLLCYCMNINLESLILRLDDYIRPDQLSKFELLALRRINKEPIAYIIGKKEFYDLDFIVNSNVLIPRSETEILVEEAIKLIKERNKKTRILDLCTGSGCIAISIAHNMGYDEKKLNDDFEIYASDYSSFALNIAKQNAKKNHVKDYIKFIKSNWFENIKPNIKFDLIISNPPYIGYNEKNIMAEETVKYEPEIALFSGPSGYEAYEKIASESSNFLCDSGYVLIECGFNQKDNIIDIFLQNKFMLEKIIYDLSGIARSLLFKKIT